MSTLYRLQGTDAAGQRITMTVTEQTLLATLTAHPSPRSLLTLYQWLMFCLGAQDAQRAAIQETWTPADRHAVATLLRQEAQWLEDGDGPHTQEEA